MTPADLRRLAASLEAGIATSPDGAPGFVADVWGIAIETGAPRARVLRVVASALDENLALEREATLAATSARHSAMVLSALPALTLVAAELFGVHALGFLWGGPAGWMCAVVGIGATAVGWRWMSRLRRRIVTPPVTTGILADTVAEVLAVTGLQTDARRMAQDCAVRWGSEGEWSDIESIRGAARETGAPVAGLLRANAEERRRAARFAVREAIERLPGSMLVPLGVCLFPAFVTLTVIPAVAGMAQGFFRATS